MLDLAFKVVLFLKITFIILGILFIYFGLWQYNSSSREERRWKWLFGDKSSVQLISLIIFFSFLFFCLFIDLFSVIDNWIDGLPNNTEIYLSLFVTILIAAVGVIVALLAALYKAYMGGSTSPGERLKLSKQNILWFCFILYFSSVVVLLFIVQLFI